MYNRWDEAIVTNIILAHDFYANTRVRTHFNRPSHGLMLYDSNPQIEKNFRFPDGKVLHVCGGDLLYLPQGSSYRMENSVLVGHCYAINFHLQSPVEPVPFVIHPRHVEEIRRSFQVAAKSYLQKPPFWQTIIFTKLYEIILFMGQEMAHSYCPDVKQKLIQPALEEIQHSFTDNDLSISKLAKLCGISEAYFRRVFFDKTGKKPKDYINQKRMEYASQLLQSQQFLVNEVAELCGYSEPCHFSREFTRIMGISPSAYRKEYRVDND